MEIELGQLDRRYEALRSRDAERERRLLASVLAAGQQVPIVVVRSATAEQYVVVDGFKRVRVLGRLRQDVVAGTCWDLSEADALIVDRLLVASSRDSVLEQGWLLRDLQDRFGLSLGVLARRFDRSTSWISRRLGLVRDLPEAVQVRVRAGELVPHAAMKYLLPLARANAADCLRLLASLEGRRLSSREMGRLYAAYVSAAARTRERLVSEPLLFLKADEEARRAPTDLAEQLLGDVRVLAGVALKLRRRVSEGLPQDMPDSIRSRTAALLRRTQDDVSRVVRLWDQEAESARCVDARSGAETQAGGTRDADDRARPEDLEGSGARGAEPRDGGSAAAALETVQG